MKICVAPSNNQHQRSCTHSFVFHCVVITRKCLLLDLMIQRYNFPRAPLCLASNYHIVFNVSLLRRLSFIIRRVCAWYCVDAGLIFINWWSSSYLHHFIFNFITIFITIITFSLHRPSSSFHVLRLWLTQLVSFIIPASFINSVFDEYHQNVFIFIRFITKIVGPCERGPFHSTTFKIGKIVNTSAATSVAPTPLITQMTTNLRLNNDQQFTRTAE